MIEQTRCKLCGEPMPRGEEMFNYHGYSGPCPKPPLAKAGEFDARAVAAIIERHLGFTNGWAISEHSYQERCENAAIEILAYVAGRKAGQ